MADRIVELERLQAAGDAPSPRPIELQQAQTGGFTSRAVTLAKRAVARALAL